LITETATVPLVVELVDGNTVPLELSLLPQPVNIETEVTRAAEAITLISLLFIFFPLLIYI
jgi:hypothetical protein